MKRGRGRANMVPSSTSTVDSNSISDSKTKLKPLVYSTNTTIIERKVKLNAPILIAGFPGPGLIGSISTSYIINKLHMKQIACVESEFIVPGVIYVGGKLRHPFRLYANKEGDVCVIVCEAPIMIEGMYSVLDTVIKWAINNKVKEVIALEGIAVEGIVPDSKRIPLILGSDGEAADTAELIHIDNDDNRITGKKKEEQSNNVAAGTIDDSNDASSSYSNAAFIGGITGGLLSSCLSNGIACKALLLSATSGIPDPAGAAILIESIGKTTNNEILKIDTQQLRKQGENVKRRMEEILRSVREQQQQQAQGQGQSRVREGIMYG